MTSRAINSTTYTSANSKAFGSITYDEATFKKDGTVYLSYGITGITFSTITDYLIFMNEVAIPLMNKTHSASLAGTNYVAIDPGVAGSDAITD